VKDPQVFGQWRTLWEGSIDHFEIAPRFAHPRSDCLASDMHHAA
jgi:hypothetical protein